MFQSARTKTILSCNFAKSNRIMRGAGPPFINDTLDFFLNRAERAKSCASYNKFKARPMFERPDLTQFDE